MQKLKNNEARPTFTGSYIKKACIYIIHCRNSSARLKGKSFKKSWCLVHFFWLMVTDFCNKDEGLLGIKRSSVKNSV